MPDEKLDPNSKKVISTIWANNGDAISHQYAGTGALKVFFKQNNFPNNI